MARNYRKIIVTGPKLVFSPGAILGLGSKEQTQNADYIEESRVEGGRGKREFKVKATVSFLKGTVLWVEEKFLPPSNSDLFEEVYMAKTYQELVAPLIPKTKVDGGTLTPNRR